MNWFLEDPTPTVALGAIALAALGVAYYQTQHRAVLAAIVIAMAVTCAMLAVERMVVTDRESVSDRIDALAAALTKNDVDAVVAFIDPEAKEARQAAKIALSRAKITGAHAGDLRVEFNRLMSPPEAIADFAGRIDFSAAREGVSHQSFVSRMTLTMVKIDGQWFVRSYEIHSLVGAGRRGG